MMKNAKYLILLFLIYTQLFFGVTSKSVPSNILQEITKGKGSGSCETVKFIEDSDFTKLCALEIYPVNITKLEDNKNQTILCLALYDFSSQWCTKSSQNIILPKFANATEFDSQVAKFAISMDIGKFCNQNKAAAISAFEVVLQNLYNDSSRCTKYCVNPTAGFPIKKICYALSWFDNILRTHNEIRLEYTDGKTVISIDDKTTRNNTEVKITGGKTDKPKSPKAEPKGEDKIDPKISNKPINQESFKGSSTILNDKSSSVVGQKENGKLFPSQTNSVAEFAKLNDSTTKNINQAPQNLNNPVKQEIALPPETKKEVIEEVENTEGKPPSVEEVSTIGKTPEINNEKLAKEQKAEEVKPNILSENTDELNENLATSGEDSDAQVPAAENEEDLPDDTGSSNQIQELPAQREVFTHYHSTTTEDDSHFFSYLVVLSLLFVCCYITYHNKKKIFAILLEGRRSRNGRGRRRPSTANYRKLDCNLEEAVTSQCNSNVTHVIY